MKLAANTFSRELEKDFIITTKRKIRDVLCADSDIQKLLYDRDGITPLFNESEDHKGEEYQGVYPYVFVPETQARDRCYICTKVDIWTPDIRKPYKTQMEVSLVVFCSVAKQDTGMYATRTDAIAYCIKDLFSRSNVHGLTWVLNEDQETILTSGYVARTITFYSKAFNDPAPRIERDAGGYSKKIYSDGDNPAITPNRYGTVIYDDSDL